MLHYSSHWYVFQCSALARVGVVTFNTLGAIVADQYLGKYLTIVYFSIIYMVGILILFVTSLPVAIEHGAAYGGLITAMIVIGLGTGGIKPNVSPLIAEQYRAVKPFIKTLRSGERVIVDPAVTVQRIYMVFYLCINIGSLSAIVTTELEKNVGFWSAYLLPLLMFVVGFSILLSGRKQYVVRPPKGSVVTNCFRALWIALMNKGNLNAAKPSYQEEYGRRYATPWDDLFIEELKRALVACKVFAFFPIYWVTFNQMLNNFVSQGKKPSQLRPIKPYSLCLPKAPTSIHQAVLTPFSRSNATPRHPKRHDAKHQPNHHHPVHPNNGPLHLPLPPPPRHPLPAHHPHLLGLPARIPSHVIRSLRAAPDLQLWTVLHRTLRLPRRASPRRYLRAEQRPRRRAGAGVPADWP